MTKKKTIIYPKTMDHKNFHQRPHSLMEQFAKHGWTVVWENMTERARPPTRLSKNFWIYHNRDDIEDDFDSFDVVFAHWAKHHSYPIDHNVLIHDCTDYFDAWQQMERDISKTADIITVVSQPLVRYFKEEHNRDAVLIENAVDTEYFKNSKAAEPKEFKDLKKPIAGFIGACGFWNDPSVMETLAKKYSVAAVGIYQNEYQKPSNVRWIPHQPWERMPEFYNNVNVGIIPTNETKTATHAVPLKAWEYLACGKPVVATWNEELERSLGDLVTLLPIAKTDGDRRQWVKIVRKELMNDTEEKQEQRIARMQEETWDKRIHEFEALIEECQ
jgi:teichuronic acid biosynthesis glycosyltransferase TuaH